MNKLLLVDGNSIMNRAFYGLPLLTDAKGRYTNAVFGFLNILFRAIDDEKPTHLLVAFDCKAPTFRHKQYDAYKGNRKGMPDELAAQLPLIKEVLTTMGIYHYQQEGIEADDILGTLAKGFSENKDKVTILSGDRDLLQLVDESIKVSLPRTRNGNTQTDQYTLEKFLEDYGFTPLEFIDVKGMMGDSSDNIPGIPGIGEKTAYKYIKKYHSIEGLYENIDDLKGKTKEKVMANKEQAFLSRDLATIKCDCDIDISQEELALGDYLNPQAFELFKELSFTRLLSRFDFEKIETAGDVESLTYEVCDHLPMMEDKLATMSPDKTSAFFMYEEEGYLGLIGLIGENKNKVSRFLYEAVGTTSDNLDRAKVLIPLLESLQESERVLFYDVKAMMHLVGNQVFEKLTNYEDLQLMFYLEKPNAGNYPLTDLGLAHTSITLHNLEELVGKGKSKQAFSSLDREMRYNYLAQAVTILYEAYMPLQNSLGDDGLLGLYNRMEKPLLPVLYGMEHEGITVDKKILGQLSDDLGEEINVLQDHIYTLAGETFNINSPKQLGIILFEKMGLPVIKKTKTGYSTNVDVLEKLKSKDPIIDLILKYRQLTKLKSTYADGLVSFVGDDNKIHTTFNQTIASTGRLSSTDPNLQNIPIRLEQGRLIRKAFIPREDHVFINADYSQIELRVLAHVSEDEHFVKAYRENKDIHRSTASQVFHVPFEEVTSAMRRNAKAVNFGIVYGISDYGLSRDLNIPVKEAKAYIETYFKEYPNVKAFLDLTVAQAYDQGYVTTLYNRKRVIPELSSSNYMQRQNGERIAMNTPIQGTAADIIKIAMLKVNKRLKKENLRSKLILQIHDELMIEATKEEQETVKTLLKEEMENAVKLLVPLTVDITVSNNWYEAK